MIGYLGLILLLTAYLTLLSPKYQKNFTLINVFASALLTIHAVIIHDAVFAFVNGFIAAILIKKYFGNHYGKITNFPKEN